MRTDSVKKLVPCSLRGKYDSQNSRQFSHIASIVFMSAASQHRVLSAPSLSMSIVTLCRANAPRLNVLYTRAMHVLCDQSYIVFNRFIESATCRMNMSIFALCAYSKRVLRSWSYVLPDRFVEFVTCVPLKYVAPYLSHFGKSVESVIVRRARSQVARRRIKSTVWTKIDRHLATLRSRCTHAPSRIFNYSPLCAPKRIETSVASYANVFVAYQSFVSGIFVLSSFRCPAPEQSILLLLSIYINSRLII